MAASIGAVTGLGALQKRLDLGDTPDRLHAALASEASAIAGEAATTLESDHPHGSGALARSVSVADQSEDDVPSFAIGTDDPVGRYVEFGTKQMAASPWLLPTLQRKAADVRAAVAAVVNGFVAKALR